MPRFPKPFFRQSRKLWYVQVGGKQINLGSNRDQAFEQYHALMGDKRAASSCSIRVAAVLVVEILDAFLEHCQIHNSPATYQWYRDRPAGICADNPSGRGCQRAGAISRATMGRLASSLV
jgi:hypothetical protein